MIPCGKCGKSFTYGNIVETDDTYEALIRDEFVRRGSNLTQEEVQRYARLMEEMLSPFDVGDTVVYLDGCYFSLDEAPIEFEGLYASHKLERLPRAIALDRPAHLLSFLCD